jgi:DNA-binding winged helix-turn-helix (wHTH) protein/tetratricopeptide (TPR) repeat protein
MATEPQSLSSFGVFELDRRSGELRKRGVRVSLSAQPFQVLVALLDRAGELVTREELQRRVWPTHTFIDFEHGLNKAVNRLRVALGDTADSPRFIETLPKRGYRFIAPVQHFHGLPRAAPLPPSVNPPEGVVPPSPNGESERQRRRRRSWVTVAALTLITLAAVGYVLTRGKSAAPAQPIRVVLARIDNHAGDPAFDHTLTQALAINLQQSPVIQVVSAHEVRRTLALMRRSAEEPLSMQIAQDICRRTSGHAVLGGSLSRLGSEYVLALNVLDCQTGDTLGAQQLRASRKEDVLGAVDGATPSLRRMLGESQGSIHRLDTRVHKTLTTESLEAFEAYTAGERNVFSQGGWSAVPFFRRAIEIDPDFAYAHAALGLVLGAFGQSAESSFHTLKAYQLRDRVSDWERHFITAQYHDRVTGDLDKMLATCEVWIQAYPHERTARNRLATVYNQLGQPARALAELERARALGHDNPIDVDVWAATMMRLNRAQEALPVIQSAVEQTPDRMPLRRLAYRLSFGAGEKAAMAAHVDWARHTPRAEPLLAEQAETDAYLGRVALSRLGFQRAVDAAVRNDFNGNAGLWTGINAVHEALFGYEGEARAQAGAAVGFEASWETRALAAVALARVGDLAAARQLAAALSEERPRGTLVQNYWLPVIRAQSYLHDGHGAQAIESLRAAENFELSDTRLPLLPAFIRGEAYLAAREGRRAAVEFQKLLKHRGAVRNSVLGALAHLGLGRALALTGEAESARTKYELFFQLWRDADQDIPILRQARVEYQLIDGGEKHQPPRAVMPSSAASGK